MIEKDGMEMDEWTKVYVPGTYYFSHLSLSKKVEWACVPLHLMETPFNSALIY